MNRVVVNKKVRRKKHGRSLVGLMDGGGVDFRLKRATNNFATRPDPSDIPPASTSWSRPGKVHRMGKTI